ncbi:LysR substrate-binding domain-containing protein [Terasakiella sp. A23]|uniref:LysR substrate-binding domain-containing protein n=1 Tax=Terasakiella sp. FCG-A23 TaxID=3080561 RepID=UPI0029536E9C|nr:LysR substrate-binding domain-containing protein [Terasakiella sp. A23]MDV7340498.1 LysR substrate-binding domain-containing protein [Terasakiella sp. A23]
MPTLRQLQYLVAVDDERHFGRAADRVHVAQPTLSAQLSTLEHRLETRLFDRSRKGVSPTPAGQEIIARARKILADVEDLVEFAKQIENPLSGRLRLGVPPTLGPYILPHIVPTLHIQFPQLKLFVSEGAPKDIQNQLAEGKLDVALSPLPIVSPKLNKALIFSEDLHVVMANDHPFAQKDTLEGKDLKNEKVLTMETGHHLHNQVKDLCTLYGAELLYDYAGTSLDALRHMVGMGAGISFFPTLYILSEIKGRDGLSVKKLTQNRPTRDIALVWRNDSRLDAQYLELAELFRKKSEEIMQT